MLERLSLISVLTTSANLRSAFSEHWLFISRLSLLISDSGTLYSILLHPIMPQRKGKYIQLYNASVVHANQTNPITLQHL
jgi:hypothetical protein